MLAGVGVAPAGMPPPGYCVVVFCLVAPTIMASWHLPQSTYCGCTRVQSASPLLFVSLNRGDPQHAPAQGTDHGHITSQGDQAWSKWGFILGRQAAFALLYAVIMLLPWTGWRDVAPAKRGFHVYALLLLALNSALAVGAALVGLGMTGGYCVVGVSDWAYHSLYPWLVYATFLADFLSENGSLELDLLYYSEMREGGCFDEDSLNW